MSGAVCKVVDWAVIATCRLAWSAMAERSPVNEMEVGRFNGCSFPHAPNSGGSYHRFQNIFCGSFFFNDARGIGRRICGAAVGRSGEIQHGLRAEKDGGDRQDEQGREYEDAVVPIRGSDGDIWDGFFTPPRGDDAGRNFVGGFPGGMKSGSGQVSG